MSRDIKLLEEIEHGAMDSTVPLADVLRKWVVLAGRIGSTDLRDWAGRELKGYGPDDALPDYRTIAAPVQVDAIFPTGWVRGQTMSPLELPEQAHGKITNDVPFRESVGELEAMLATAGDAVKISPLGAQEIAWLWNHEQGGGQHVERIYWSVNKAAIRGVLDRVRTTLAERIAEAREKLTVSAAPVAAADAYVELHHAGSGRATVSAAWLEALRVTADVPRRQLRRVPWGAWKTWATIASAIVGVATVLSFVWQAAGW